MVGCQGRDVKNTRIAAVHGRRVWDSRGRPTVEAEVRLQGGAIGEWAQSASARRLAARSRRGNAARHTDWLTQSPDLPFGRTREDIVVERV